MIKQHIKLTIHCSDDGLIFNHLTTILGANNEGNILFSIPDVIAVLKYKKAVMPNVLKQLDFEIIATKLLISIDNGESYCCTLDWVETQELNVSTIAIDNLATHLTDEQKQRLFDNITAEIEKIDEAEQENAVQEFYGILNKTDNNNLEPDGQE